MQTGEPQRVPLYTSPKPPASNGWDSISRLDERVKDVGSIILAPHMLLSSRKHFREAVLKGGRPSTAYASLRVGNVEGEHGDVLRPENQQATSNHHLEGSAHIARTLLHTIRC